MTAPSNDADGPAQDVKDKYREALERKKQKSEAHADGSTEYGGKIHGAHGAESHRKEFRRKSGG